MTSHSEKTPDEAVEAAAKLGVDMTDSTQQQPLEDMPIHYTFMTADDSVIAACGASDRFDVRFRSSEKRDRVTCQDCLAHTRDFRG